MNIYEKLQNIRVKIQEIGIKKSGKNNHTRMEYFELSDILPIVNKLMLENKMTSIVSFTPELATLTLVDCEKPDSESIVFTSPMSTAHLANCHPVQNLGAVETYERRYLYMIAFEITESDVLDMTLGEKENTYRAKSKGVIGENGKGSDKYITKDQAVEAWEIAERNKNVVDTVLSNYGYERLGEIKKKEYTNFCESLKTELQDRKEKRSQIADDIEFENVDDIFANAGN